MGFQQAKFFFLVGSQPRCGEKPNLKRNIREHDGDSAGERHTHEDTDLFGDFDGLQVFQSTHRDWPDIPSTGR